ncbi:MAG: lysophospholipid acyltransferase family protein [Acidobacteriota bacterium]
MIFFLKLIGRPLFRLLFSVEYYGLENIPREGAVILAGNHPSYLDPVLVGLPVERTIYFMAWDALFKVPLLGWLIRKLGAFPVDIRKGKGESAYLEAVRVLSQGLALGIFPEGQRSDQGPMGELRTGVARMAIETGAVIVPITIGGASRAWPKWKLLPKPAKIIVRYHAPISIPEEERTMRGEDKEFHREVMQRVAEAINRSLTAALREDASIEKWYTRPPSHIRSYEWAPVIASLIATIITAARADFPRHALRIWIAPVIYFLYLMADLALIKPSRLAKWARNSMPVWLILAWHYPLTRAIEAPAGGMNLLLAGATVAAFFPFFYENYFTLQKFVRGIVVAYYFSLLFLLGWPHTMGTFISVASFIILFSLRERTVYYPATVAVMTAATAVAIYLTRSASRELILFAALGALTIAYLQTFVGAAYDIRRAGNVSVQRAQE